jgi:hypothetical protein
MSSFTTRALPPSTSMRTAGAARRGGLSPSAPQAADPSRANKKPRGPFRAPGFKFSSKRWNPGHPVKARRSSLRSERLRRERRSVRDSSAPNEGAHAPPPVRRSVPQSEASCRDRINMGSTMKTVSDKRVLQYVSAAERKSISFSGDSVPERPRRRARRMLPAVSAAEPSAANPRMPSTACAARRRTRPHPCPLPEGEGGSTWSAEGCERTEHHPPSPPG